MPDSSWLAPLRRGNIASGPVANSFTNLTQISPVPDVVTGANMLTAGSSVKIWAKGRFGSNGTPVYTFGLYYGGTGGVLLCSSAALTTFTSANSSTFIAQFEIDVRTDGTSGTAVASGRLMGIQSTSGSLVLMPQAQLPVVTIDTTAAKAIVLAVSCGTQHGLNVVVIDQWDTAI